MVERRNIKNAFKVTINREFDLPVEKVFSAWLDPKHLGDWLFGTPGGVDKVSEVEPCVGGDFRIGERRGEDMAIHVGTYHEITHFKKIVFSYYFETNNDEKPTNVIIEFDETDGGCMICITHEMDDIYSEYEDLTLEGWKMIFDGLDKILN